MRHVRPADKQLWTEPPEDLSPGPCLKGVCVCVGTASRTLSKGMPWTGKAENDSVQEFSSEPARKKMT